MAAAEIPTPEQMQLLAQTIRRVVHQRRLSSEDARDFAQAVHLRLGERRYEVFAQFAGRSTFRTYLAVVVMRLLLDWRAGVNESGAASWSPEHLCALCRTGMPIRTHVAAR